MSAYPDTMSHSFFQWDLSREPGSQRCGTRRQHGSRSFEACSTVSNTLITARYSYLLFNSSRAGPAPVAQSRPSGAFSGGGHTLGSDEVESSFIPDPSAPEGEGVLCTASTLSFFKPRILQS